MLFQSGHIHFTAALPVVSARPHSGYHLPEYSNEWLYHWRLTWFYSFKVFKKIEKKKKAEDLRRKSDILLSLFPAFSRNLLICLVWRSYYFPGFFFFLIPSFVQSFFEPSEGSTRVLFGLYLEQTKHMWFFWVKHSARVLENC